jgi:hypothetical protein
MSKHYVIAPFIWIFFVIVFTWVNTYPSVVHAGPVGNININGAKTRPDVIRFFMDTKEGEEFDPARFANDIQRLKNTGLFYDISSDIQEKDGRRNITLSLTNKFSFIPIFKFKQGGGTSILTLGAYEVNYLDRMLEIGAQYERMSGKNGFVAWFRHPYFLSSKNRVGVEIYDHIFTLPLLTLEGEEEAFFDNNQSQWTIFIERRVKENLLAGLALNYYTNKFTPDNSTADKTTRNTQFNTKQELHDGTTISARPRLVLGRINADRFYVKGTKLSFSVEVAENAIGSDFSFIKGLIHSSTNSISAAWTVYAVFLTVNSGGNICGWQTLNSAQLWWKKQSGLSSTMYLPIWVRPGMMTALALMDLVPRLSALGWAFESFFRESIVPYCALTGPEHRSRLRALDLILDYSSFFKRPGHNSR